MLNSCLSAYGVLLAIQSSTAFAPAALASSRHVTVYATMADDAARMAQKQALLGILGRQSSQKEGILDPVLADPFTKEAIRINTKGVMLGGSRRSSITYEISSSTNVYEGSSDTYINLLEPKKAIDSPSTETILTSTLKRFTPLVPPPLRAAMASAVGGDEYIPMRDLFTSPAVSFAYERGWRQGFAQAGFPGPDVEFSMAKEYFAPAVAASSTIVDMSCATGLFTRRFVKEDVYDRVLGCDYSDSMLTEARRRINEESLPLSKTKLDLVRLDVGQIPMQNGTVDALHAGAAMHCWPDLQAAMSEIHRVLKPGGRYFATTFLSQYFGNLQKAEGGDAGPSTAAFQYFQTTDQLRNLVKSGGFDADKIKIEVLGVACVVIRCEK